MFYTNRLGIQWLSQSTKSHGMTQKKRGLSSNGGGV